MRLVLRLSEILSSDKSHSPHNGIAETPFSDETQSDSLWFYTIREVPYWTFGVSFRRTSTSMTGLHQWLHRRTWLSRRGPSRWSIASTGCMLHQDMAKLKRPVWPANARPILWLSTSALSGRHDPRSFFLISSPLSFLCYSQRPREWSERTQNVSFCHFSVCSRSHRWTRRIKLDKRRRDICPASAPRVSSRTQRRIYSESRRESPASFSAFRFRIPVTWLPVAAVRRFPVGRLPVSVSFARLVTDRPR